MWTRISKSVAPGRTTDRGSTLGRDIDFPLRHPVQIDTGANLSSWPVDTGGSLAGGKSDGS